MADSKENPGFKECVILHVDDDMPDSTVFQRVLLSKGYAGTYRRVRSVDAAKEYLQRRGSYSDPVLFPRPDIIVTDLSIRSEDGVGLIRWIRRKTEHGKIPVIAFSACKDVDARQQSIDAGAVFIEKTSHYAGVLSKVREIMNHCPTDHRPRAPWIVAVLNLFWPYVASAWEVSGRNSLRSLSDRERIAMQCVVKGPRSGPLIVTYATAAI